MLLAMCTNTHTSYLTHTHTHTHIPSPTGSWGGQNYTQSQAGGQTDSFLCSSVFGLWPNNGLVLQQVPLPVGAISIVKVNLFDNDY